MKLFRIFTYTGSQIINMFQIHLFKVKFNEKLGHLDIDRIRSLNSSPVEKIVGTFIQITYTIIMVERGCNACVRSH